MVLPDCLHIEYGTSFRCVCVFLGAGRASTYLTEKLAEGSKILMSGPHGHQLYFGQGKFLVGKDTVNARVCGALAGGSGTFDLGYEGVGCSSIDEGKSL